MLGRVHSAGADRFQYNLLWVLDHVLGVERVDRVLARRRSRVQQSFAASLARKGPGELRELERKRDVTPADFRREHLRPNVPIVLEGAARDWACCATWSPESLAARFGELEIGLINTSVDELRNPRYAPAVETMTFGRAVANIVAGKPTYPRFIPLLHERPELQDEFDHAWLGSLRSWSRFQTMFQMFMGPAHSDTGMHCAMPNNLFVQVHGRKRWMIFPPSYNPALRPLLRRSSYFLSQVDARAPDPATHPEFAHVDGWSTELEPGDVLYLPPFFWHQVYNPTVSLGVAYRWLDFPSIARSSLTQALLTLMATNPPIWVTRQNKADFTKTFARAR